MSEGSSAALEFPDGPKLELDQLIDQLVERAQGVQRAQGRLRSLLRAIELITGDLAVEGVLRHVVEAGCALAGAKYGALGVIAHDGSLEQFIHVGIDEALVDRIGHLPEGKGLLGALITDPRPIRLTHITDDPRSSGFPDHHPPMDSFLGVPVRVRGEVFGNLYLTESDTGNFTAEDEELVRSLAIAAGTAISNARLYDESRMQQRWLAASADISAHLLADSGEDPLQMIARRASEVADADLVAVSLVTPDEQHTMVEIAVGHGAEALRGQRFPLVDTLAGRAIESRAPLLLRSSGEDQPSHAHLSALESGPVMVIPLIGSAKVLGALSITRARGRPAFTANDLHMATGFANHASVALELSTARADQQRVVLLEDRDRIARDLHDHVIQQLFAIGMSLEGVATMVGSNERASQMLHDRVDDIDRTIRQIRTSIFELRGPLGSGGTEDDSLRRHVLTIGAELTPSLGFSPGVAFSGQVDAAVTGALADDVEACVREALTNVAKHARATNARVDIAVAHDTVTVTVFDDGIGSAGAQRSSGLANLRTRAEQRGGSFELTGGPSGGTELTWKAPIA